jgi:hypothetical protein
MPFRIKILFEAFIGCAIATSALPARFQTGQNPLAGTRQKLIFAGKLFP